MLVAARVVRQLGTGQDPLGAEEVVGAVLDRHDPGMAGQPQHRLRLDAGAGAAGDVVQHHRQPAGVRDRAEVLLHGVLRRSAVVRRHHQHPVRARLLRLQRQFHGVPGVGGAHARDDRGPLPDRLPHGPHQRRLLGVRRGRRFAGRAVEHQPVASLGDQPFGEPLGTVQVEGARRGEGRDHGAQEAAEGRGGGRAGRRAGGGSGRGSRESGGGAGSGRCGCHGGSLGGPYRTAPLNSSTDEW